MLRYDFVVKLNFYLLQTKEVRVQHFKKSTISFCFCRVLFLFIGRATLLGPGNTDEEEKGSAAAALAGQIIWKDLSHLHNWEEKQSLEDNENPLSHLSPQPDVRSVKYISWVKGTS